MEKLADILNVLTLDTARNQASRYKPRRAVLCLARIREPYNHPALLSFRMTEKNAPWSIL